MRDDGDSKDLMLTNTDKPSNNEIIFEEMVIAAQNKIYGVLYSFAAEQSMDTEENGAGAHHLVGNPCKRPT